MVEDVQVKVRCAASAPADLDALEAAAAAVGFRPRRRIPELGLLTGAIAADRLDALRATPGVLAVDVEGSVRLPPMDEGTPQ